MKTSMQSCSVSGITQVVIYRSGKSGKTSSLYFSNIVNLIFNPYTKVPCMYIRIFCPSNIITKFLRKKMFQFFLFMISVDMLDVACMMASYFSQPCQDNFLFVLYQLEKNNRIS